MKTYLFLVILLASFPGPAQEKMQRMNQLDSAGKKNGYWFINQKDSAGHISLLEEGVYNHGEKTGKWKHYYPNGNLQNELTYVNNRPKGPARMYREDGSLSEEGEWERNRWVHWYKLYTHGSCLELEVKYDDKGRTLKRTTYYKDSCNRIREECSFNSEGYSRLSREFDKKGKIIKEDTILRRNPIWCDFDSGTYKDLCSRPFSFQDTINGVRTLYNKQRKISKEGTFKNGKLMDGKVFIYNEEGILQRIAVFKDGIYQGDEK
ncbi:MAG: hypothetical protein ACHQRM_05580 [Bacteroidia bacterium]